MSFQKLIPLTVFAVLVILTIGWLFLDWSFVTLLPYFIGLTVVFVCGAAYAFAPKGIIRLITGAFLLIAATISLVLLTNLSDVRSTWELLAMTGLIGIHLYLYLITRASQLIKGKLAMFLALPLITCIVSVEACNLYGTSLSLAWWSLFIALLLAALGLLFGYRKKQAV